MWIKQQTENKKKVETVSGAPLPRFVKKFLLHKKIVKAELEISALGIFHIEINGKEIPEYFMPGYTNYHKFVNLCTYDVTDMLDKENIIAVTVGDGWFAGRIGYTTTRCVFGEEVCLYATLKISYENGEKEEICTDGSWRVYPCEIRYADFFNGEYIDERLRVDYRANYDSLPFAVEAFENRNFHPYDMEAVVCVDKLLPQITRKHNSLLLDFGQNFAGVISFKVKGKSGLKVVVRHAEMLACDGNLYVENLRSARCTDTLILSDAEVCFSPKFTYHGFRYAEILVQNGRIDEVEISEIVGLVLSQNMRRTGYFECSDKIVNKVYENAYWGQVGNFISVPTDCPQRDERLGWTGDAQIFCDSAMYNADCKKFYQSYMDVLRGDCLENGSVPSFAPFFCEIDESNHGAPCWGDAVIIIPYMHYLAYGDKSILEENFAVGKRWIEFYQANLVDGKVENLPTFGDWLSVKETTDEGVMKQCYYGYSLFLFAKICEILGEDSSSYLQAHEQAKRAFWKYYVDDKNRVKSDTQTAYLVAYVAGFMSAEEIKKNLLQTIHRQEDTLTTGFIGVRFLLPVLSEIGETELAYKLMRETKYPSWGYSVLNGATTIWERWNGYTQEEGFFNPSMNSFNHYSLGSCVYWLYAYVLGIKRRGKGSFLISPDFSNQLDYAKGRYDWDGGEVRVEWRYEADEICLTVGVLGDADVVYDFGDRAVLRKEERDGEQVFYLSK